MVAKIFEFPGRSVRHWNALECVIRNKMAAEGWSENDADNICARMKYHHEKILSQTEFKYALELTPGLSEEQEHQLRNNIGEMLKSAEKNTSALVLHCLGIIVGLEIELYRASMK